MTGEISVAKIDNPLPLETLIDLAPQFGDSPKLMEHLPSFEASPPCGFNYRRHHEERQVDDR
jgi:hypothetical protein